MVILGFIINLLITALVVFLCAKYLKGISVNGYKSACIVALVLAVLNALASWLLGLLGMPSWGSGLIAFAVNMCINAGLIMLADKMLDGFKVDGFKWALVLALICALVSALVGGVI
ncbi:MAG: phage holin family protein [Paludibacteraceae bacterium]|nr:phage holin family protein [Paludibacteraceae bacterium]MBQ9705818.1 phage holin family protein [Paludibacteraceae bacterium]MBR1466307.1 phage holin family protein [Bacteroidaceae bacterium]